MTRMTRNQIEGLWMGAVAGLFIFYVLDPVHTDGLPHTLAGIAFVGIAVPLVAYLLWCRWFETKSES